MNHTEKMDACRALMKKMEEILDAKGRDYSGTQDAMSNFKDFGWKGILVRIGDKFHRVKNLSKQQTQAVLGESIEDTLLDMANYCILALVMKEEEEGPKPVLRYYAAPGTIVAPSLPPFTNQDLGRTVVGAPVYPPEI